MQTTKWIPHIKSYIFDWVLLIILLAPVIVLNYIEPYHRQFSLEDKTISYPITDETFPTWLLLLLSIGIPSITFIIFSLKAKSFREAHHAFLSLFVSLYISFLITSIFKVTIGRHRPDWLARCKPESINGSLKDLPLKLSDINVCTEKDENLLDYGQQSFISGHASNSFAGLFLCSIYLAGKLRLFDKKGYVIKNLICIIPTILALFISITRVQDYRHHWQDVLVGGIVGIISAVFAYRQYFPGIFDTESDVCYPSRLDYAKIQNQNTINNLEEGHS